MPINRSHITCLGFAALLAYALPTMAQDVEELVVQAESDPAADGRVENRFRIGLDCSPSSPTLKSHLRLEADTGLTVRMVLPNSPAAVAGIRQHDVIVEANGHPVGEVMDLVREVNDAGTNEMSVTLYREGTEHVLNVTPEERDEDEITRLRDGFRNRLGQRWGDLENAPPEFRRLMEQLPQMDMQFFGNNGFGRINPGIAIPQMPSVPNSFNLRIERDNDKVTVQRGNDRYEVTIDTLDQLPEDIRPMVENMLNGGQFNFRGLMRPSLPAAPHAMPPRPAAPADPRMNDRFDGLELQLKQLQDAIRKMEEGKNR